MRDAPARWTLEDARALAARRGAHAMVDELLHRRRTVPAPNVWTHVVEEPALRARADELELLAARGVALPLYGVPIAIKDNIDVDGLPTTAGVPEFATVARRSAPIVARLLEAGAIVAGKANLDQFATGLSGTRAPHYGIVCNPVDPDYIAGGSSSGSAVAVALGLVPAALGTDTAGSGRVPAARCGLVGLKPTRGRLSTEGVVPASPSFDTVSLLTTNCSDATALFDVLAGAEPPVLDPGPWRIGVPGPLEWYGDDDARRCFDIVQQHLTFIGTRLVPVDIAPFRAAAELLYGSALVAERYASFGAFVEAHPDAIDDAVRTIVLGAREHDATSIETARAELRSLRDETQPVWEGVDALLFPTIARHPTVAAALDDSIGTSRELGTYTNFVNLLDLAAVAVPAGARTSGLPFGVTFVGPADSDHLLLRIAATYTGEPLPAPNGPGFRIAVVGAHLLGQPLNHQLVELGARFVERTTTSGAYRLYDLNLVPRKPGMVRDPDQGAQIEVEVWELDAAGFGTFVAAIASPLGVGSVELADGTRVPGFLCEPHALAAAREITSYGGWRAYLAVHTSS